MHASTPAPHHRRPPAVPPYAASVAGSRTAVGQSRGERQRVRATDGRPAERPGHADRDRPRPASRPRRRSRAAARPKSVGGRRVTGEQQMQLRGDWAEPVASAEWALGQCGNFGRPLGPLARPHPKHERAGSVLLRGRKPAPHSAATTMAGPRSLTSTLGAIGRRPRRARRRAACDRRSGMASASQSSYAGSGCTVWLAPSMPIRPAAASSAIRATSLSSRGARPSRRSSLAARRSSRLPKPPPASSLAGVSSQAAQRSLTSPTSRNRLRRRPRPPGRRRPGAPSTAAGRGGRPQTAARRAARCPPRGAPAGWSSRTERSNRSAPASWPEFALVGDRPTTAPTGADRRWRRSRPAPPFRLVR